MHHVVDLVVFEREDFGQPTANLVDQNIARSVFGRCNPAIGGRDRDGIEIVVAEFAARAPRAGL